MKQTLMNQAGRLRMIALLFVLSMAFATANAQLSSDEISEAILVEGSVPVRWTNDADHPWIIGEDSDGKFMRTPETAEDNKFTTTLSFTFTSSYPVEISYSWRRWGYNNTDFITIVVDGEEKVKITSDSWTTNNAKYIVSSGSHSVQFVSTSGSKVSRDDYYGGIRNLRVWECKELETACLKPGSMPLTFTNDPDHIWITEDGYIRSNTESIDGEISSKISTTFTIDRPSVFSFECRNGNKSNLYTNVVIDESEYSRSYTGESWEYYSIVLYPGTHTVEFENKHTRSGSSYWSQIRNVCLDQTWYNVTLNSPGELGVRLLQALEGKNLQDAELVKITGAMNDADWSTLKQLSGVKAIDFTESGITSIPASSCSGLSYLSTVMLPETLKEIGNSAFTNTSFHRVAIPASVETIGNEVWYNTSLKFIDFAEDSKLTSIGYGAFRSTHLIEFNMPNTVNTLGREKLGSTNYKSYLFGFCTSLNKIHLSDGLTTIPETMAYGCTALTEVHLPVNVTSIDESAFYNASIQSLEIPESVTTINYCAFYNNNMESLVIPKNVSGYGLEAFANCKNLKTLTLNSHCWDMDYTFSGCTALETVILPCATPPTISNDPFSGVTKSNVKLLVPDFAVEAYRSNPYWYGFTTIMADDAASKNDYWAIRGNLTLDSNHVMQGTPSVEMMTGGKLTMLDGTQQAFDEFIYKTQESSPAGYMSGSNAVTANRLTTKFYVETENKWFFFSPVVDVNMSDVTYSSTDSWVIRYYDGARRATENASSGNWVNVPSDGTLHSHQGYIIQANAAGWLTLPAASSTEHSKFFGANEVTMALADNPCETEANAGWNFVANPYPTYYDIYYIDMQAPITVWTGSTYRAYSLNDGDRGDNTFVLRPMQPFFVQKATEGLTTGMPLVGRQINTTIDRTRAPRRIVVDENRHKLNLELFRADNAEADDYTSIVLNEEASMGYEKVRDASKFMTLDATVAQIYSLGDNNLPLAINERPYASGIVGLGVSLPETGATYTIAARRIDRQAWLYDAETGMEHDLTAGDYVFTASKAGVDHSRFSIRFAPAQTGVEDMDASTVKVTGNAGYITVIAADGAEVAVYAADGRSVAETTVAAGSIDIPAAPGIYVVKVDGKVFKTIVK